MPLTSGGQEVHDCAMKPQDRPRSVMGCLMRAVSGVALAAILVPWTSIAVRAGDGPSSRVLHVTVRDPSDRFVVGLEREHFQILENGVERPVGSFRSVDSPISIALVGLTASARDFDDPAPSHADDEVIAANSVVDATRQLAASKNLRKVIITAGDAGGEGVPAGIQLMRAENGSVRKAVTEARCTYVVEFAPATASSHIEVRPKPVKGLPALRASWQ